MDRFVQDFYFSITGNSSELMGGVDEESSHWTQHAAGAELQLGRSALLIPPA
jgi:hypothetical protein